MAPALGDTVGIIEAPDAAGARVGSYSSMYLDHRGRAILPYLSPYRQNDVELIRKGYLQMLSLKVLAKKLRQPRGLLH